MFPEKPSHSSHENLIFAPDETVDPADSAILTEDRIERYYVRRILNGEIPSGTRLPSNKELADLWGTSCSTIQRALIKLVAAGLIDRTPRRGTFVRQKTQRVFVGILFGPDLIEETTAHYRRLNAALVKELESEFVACRTYDNLGTPDPAELEKTLMHLRLDQKTFDFRGYICIVSVPDTVPLDELIPLKVPRAMEDPFQPGNDLIFDSYDFGESIVTSMARQGAKRLWYLWNNTPLKGDSALVGAKKAAAALGLPEIKVHPMSFQKGPDIEIMAYREAMTLLSRTKKKDLPDAIIVSDDTAARGLVMALLKHGLRVPEDIRLGILGNEGINLHYSVPVTRYDYPITEAAERLAELLKLRMEGQAGPATPLILRGRLCEAGYP